PALANVAVGGDVSQRAQPAAPGAALRRRGGVLGARLEAAPPPQSLPALSRPGELAGAARGAEADGGGRSHRPRQAPAGAGLAAGGDRSWRRRRVAGRAQAWGAEVPDPADAPIAPPRPRAALAWMILRSPRVTSEIIP